MKQTAVEWLVQEANLLENNGWILPLIKQAKEMEKEQIIDAHYDGKINGMDISHPLSRIKEITETEYYNETFKSE
jgi:hypothetical protein